MHGNASLLDATTTVCIEVLWYELEIKQGLIDIKAPPFPYFSWHFKKGIQPLTKNTWLIANKSQPLGKPELCHLNPGFSFLLLGISNG
jgi:hypothetical protein